MKKWDDKVTICVDKETCINCANAILKMSTVRDGSFVYEQTVIVLSKLLNPIDEPLSYEERYILEGSYRANVYKQDVPSLNMRGPAQ